jgi:hypothetical protein
MALDKDRQMKFHAFLSLQGSLRPLPSLSPV